MSIDCKSVENLKTVSSIPVTLAPRVTLAGIGPVKPVNTPLASIIGVVGVPDTAVHWAPSPLIFDAETEIE